MRETIKRRLFLGKISKMKQQTLLSILVFIFILTNIFSMYFIEPSKAEVGRYFEKNKCTFCSGDAYGEVYQMRRQTAMLWGQIFKVPAWWVAPNFILYTTTPFNYYHEVNHGDGDWSTYTWVDTRSGRFVYNAVSGEYVKKISSTEDPMKKWGEDMEKEVQRLREK